MAPIEGLTVFQGSRLEKSQLHWCTLIPGYSSELPGDWLEGSRQGFCLRMPPAQAKGERGAVVGGAELCGQTWHQAKGTKSQKPEPCPQGGQRLQVETWSCYFPQIITQELISTFLMSTALWGWRMLGGEEKPINYLIRKH